MSSLDVTDGLQVLEMHIMQKQEEATDLNAYALIKLFLTFCL